MSQSNRNSLFLTANTTYDFVVMKNNTLVRQFWPFFYYGDFQFIELIAIFCRIDGFFSEKGTYSRLHTFFQMDFLSKRTFLGWSPCFMIVESLLFLDQVCFQCTFWFWKSKFHLQWQTFFISLEKNRI